MYGVIATISTSGTSGHAGVQRAILRCTSRNRPAGPKVETGPNVGEENASTCCVWTLRTHRAACSSSGAWTRTPSSRSSGLAAAEAVLERLRGP